MFDNSILKPENWMVKVGDLTESAAGWQKDHDWQVLTECGLDLADDFRLAILFSLRESRQYSRLSQNVLDTRVRFVRDEQKAVSRVNFHHMLMDGKHELSYAGPWEDTETTFQFVEDKDCWVRYNEQEQEVMNFFNHTKYTSFILRTCKPEEEFVSAYNYLIDLKWKVQRNLSTGRMRKIREWEDPLSSFSSQCKANPITSQMLGEYADTFLCSISQDVPLVPVLASDGLLYDYDSLKKWMHVKKGQGTPVVSPLTNEELTSDIRPARRDRSVMESLAKRRRTS